MSIITKKTLIAGQPGTKKWIQQYGEALTCVRYKYDTINKRKIKTVELIVETETWEMNQNRIPANKIIELQVNYEEVHLQKLIKSAGGRWNREKKLWELPYKEVVALGLEKRAVRQTLKRRKNA